MKNILLNFILFFAANAIPCLDNPEPQQVCKRVCEIVCVQIEPPVVLSSEPVMTSTFVPVVSTFVPVTLPVVSTTTFVPVVSTSTSVVVVTSKDFNKF